LSERAIVRERERDGRVRAYERVSQPAQELESKGEEIVRESGRVRGVDCVTLQPVRLASDALPQALGPPVVWTRDRLATYCNQEQYDQFCTYVTKRTEYYKYIWEQITYPLISALPSVRSPLAPRCTNSTPPRVLAYTIAY